MLNRLNITAFVFLALAFVLGRLSVKSYTDSSSMMQNVAAEFIGIALTVLVIDQLHKSLETKRSQKSVANAMIQDIRAFLIPDQPFHSKGVYLERIAAFATAEGSVSNAIALDELVNKLAWRIEENDDIGLKVKHKLQELIQKISMANDDYPKLSNLLSELNDFLELSRA